MSIDVRWGDLHTNVCYLGVGGWYISELNLTRGRWVRNRPGVIYMLGIWPSCYWTSFEFRRHNRYLRIGMPTRGAWCHDPMLSASRCRMACPWYSRTVHHERCLDISETSERTSSGGRRECETICTTVNAGACGASTSQTVLLKSILSGPMHIAVSSKIHDSMGSTEDIRAICHKWWMIGSPAMLHDNLGWSSNLSTVKFRAWSGCLAFLQLVSYTETNSPRLQGSVMSKVDNCRMSTGYNTCNFKPRGWMVVGGSYHSCSCKLYSWHEANISFVVDKYSSGSVHWLVNQFGAPEISVTFPHSYRT